MYQTIVMECQTLEGGNSCEDCIVCKECHLKNKLKRYEKENTNQSKLAVATVTHP